MRRTLAGLFLTLALASITVAVSGWLLKRTAFDPHQSAGAAHEVLQEPGIREEIVRLVADVTARPLEMDSIAVEGIVRGVLANPRSQPFVEKIVKDSHAMLIGLRQYPPYLTGQQLMQLVRSQAVVTMPRVELPVKKVALLSTVRATLNWLIPIAAIAALVLLVLGFAAHPDRASLTRTFGIGLVVLGVALGILGYVVPRFVVPLFTDSPWGKIPGILAHQHLLLLGLVVGALIIVGLLLMASSGMIRRQRRWSAPINTYRYGDQHRWS